MHMVIMDSQQYLSYEMLAEKNTRRIMQQLKLQVLFIDSKSAHSSTIHLVMAHLISLLS